MKDDDDLLDLLVQKAALATLPGMAKLAPSLLDRAAKDNLSTLDLLHRLCDEEKQSRLRSAVDRRLREARFPEVNTIDGFNFDFDPGARIFALATSPCTTSLSLAKGINPLFIGVPGVNARTLYRESWGVRSGYMMG